MQSILVIGLGSMGNRRIRCLKYLNEKYVIYGFDTNKIRRHDAEISHKIITYDNYDLYFKNKIDLVIISTPPDHHEIYVFDCLKKNIKFFVEAGVFNENFIKIQRFLFNNLNIGMPSSTLYFHPAISKIKNIISNNELGSISNIIYHSGQYLPDWHTYENVSDFYVSNKKTGGAREIVPFELTWLTKLFGFPRFIYGNCKKTINIEGAETIDDTYNVILEYNNFSINLIVDVVSRYATRKLTINGDIAQLEWSWDKDEILIKSNDNILKRSYSALPSNNKYNKNISEEMYIKEMDKFINYDIDYKCNIVNNFFREEQVIELLNKVEKSFVDKQFQSFINVGIVINISLESKRLSLKHLKKIKEEYILEYLIKRILNKTQNIDNLKLILNVSEKSRDKYFDILYFICKKYNIYLFFSNHSNIPKRINNCADYFGLSHIISVDGDDILVSADGITSIFNKFNSNKYEDLVTTKGLPFGMNVMGFSKELLENSLLNDNSLILETGWGKIFNCNKTFISYNFEKIENFNNLRLTLDYDDDFNFFKEILENVDCCSSDLDIINHIISNNLFKINEKRIKEYWDNFNKEK